MRQKAVWLLCVLLLGALAYNWYQHNRIVRMEAQLGKIWSNEFSLSYFSKLGDLAQQLERLGAGGPVQSDDRESLIRLVSNMQVTMTNTLHDVSGLLGDVPEASHLRGYLNAVDDSVRRIPDKATNVPLTAEQQQDMQRHAELASAFLVTVKKHFEDFQPNGGFTSSQTYWGRNFLSDKRWRATLAEMDLRAQSANYPPRQ